MTPQAIRTLSAPTSASPARCSAMARIAGGTRWRMQSISGQGDRLEARSRHDQGTIDGAAIGAPQRSSPARSTTAPSPTRYATAVPRPTNDAEPFRRFVYKQPAIRHGPRAKFRHKDESPRKVLLKDARLGCKMCWNLFLFSAG